MSIAQGLVEVVAEYLPKDGAWKAMALKVRVGALTGTADIGGIPDRYGDVANNRYRASRLR